MIENKCEKCDFWLQAESGNGKCRRYPPTLCIQLIPVQKPGVIGGSQQVGFEPVDAVNWPTTNKDDYCGEFNGRQ